jgi:hypothetical protein
MKKYIIAGLIVFLFALPAWAIFVGQRGAGGVGAAGEAAAMCTTSTADICEDWEAPGSQLSWSDTTTGGTISHTSAHTGSLSCTDKGSYAIDYEMDSGTADDLYSTYDIGSQQNVVYANFYVNPISLGDLANFSSHQVIGGSNNSNGSIPGWSFTIRNTSGSPTFRLSYNNGSASSTPYSISTGTWYRVSVQVERVGDGEDIVRMWVNGVLDYEVTDATLITSYLTRYVTFGTNGEVASATSVHFQADNLEIDYSELPGACP